MLTDGYANVDVTIRKSHEWLSSVSDAPLNAKQSVKTCSETSDAACHPGFRRRKRRRRSGGSKVHAQFDASGNVDWSAAMTSAMT